MASNLNAFILGSPRSGTSITYLAMREVFDLEGRGESHVFPIFQKLLHEFYLYTNRFSRVDGVLARDLNFQDFKLYTIQYIREFYANSYRLGGWVDKTPGAESILGSKIILETFPDAKIIVTNRNGIEVVESYRKKFKAGFEEACLSWDRCMSATRRIREYELDFIEVDQYDMANNPLMIASKISKYLNQSEEKTEKLASFFRERRFDQNSGHDWRNRLTLKDTGWSVEELSTFVRVCGANMSHFGYEL